MESRILAVLESLLAPEIPSFPQIPLPLVLKAANDLLTPPEQALFLTPASFLPSQAGRGRGPRTASTLGDRFPCSNKIEDALS